jgi:hypothetical protein
VPIPVLSMGQDAVVSSRARRVWKWLWSRTPVEQKTETWTCPKCGVDVEVSSSSPGAGRRPDRFGPMWLPPTEAERLAACPTHGHGRESAP